MSIWDRFGNALKAGAKGAADSILSPPSTSSQPTNGGGQVMVQPIESAGGLAPMSSWKNWIVPAVAAGLVGYIILKPSRGSSR